MSSLRFVRKVPISPVFPIMDSPRHASPLRRTRKLKLSLNDRSFIAGHRSIRRHPRNERMNEQVAIRLAGMSLYHFQPTSNRDCGRNLKTSIFVLTKNNGQSINNISQKFNVRILLWLLLQIDVHIICYKEKERRKETIFVSNISALCIIFHITVKILHPLSCFCVLNF